MKYLKKRNVLSLFWNKERVAVSGTDVLREIVPAEGTEAWEKESKAIWTAGV